MRLAAALILQLPARNMKIQKGYTMIELLVVIVIMIVLGTLGISKFGALQKDQALQGSVLNVQSFIRTAQANATTRVACADSAGPTGGAIWIVKFTSSTKLDFYCKLGTAADQLVRSQDIEAGVTITSITDSSGGGCAVGSSTTITFAPLYGNVTFGGCSITDPSLIKILLTSSGKNKTLIIDKGGAVYEQ